jgi:hypothetical protein
VVFTDEPSVTRIVWLSSLVLGYSRLIWARFVMHQDLHVMRCYIVSAMPEAWVVIQGCMAKSIPEATAITLMEAERARLEGLARSTKTEYRLRQRTRLVLEVANGVATAAIGRLVGCTTCTASKSRVTHKPKHDQWLKRHWNVHFHFIPTHSSWLYQVESWFSVLSGKSLAGVSFNSIAELIGGSCLNDWASITAILRDRTPSP